MKFKRSFCITRWFQIKMLPTTKFHNFSISTKFILVICSSNIVLVTLLTNLIVDTVFWHVSKMVVLWRKSCRFERNQNMHSVRVCRLSRSRWARRIFQEDADPHDSVIGRWKLPMSQKGKKRFELYEDSDDLAIIFSIVCFRKSLLFSQVMCLP